MAPIQKIFQIIIIFILSLSFTQTSYAENYSKSQVNKVFRSLSKNKLDQAAKHISEINTKDAQTEADLLLWAAKTAYFAEKYETSISYLEKAWKKSKLLKEYISYWMGINYIAIENYDKALLWLKAPRTETKTIHQSTYWARIIALVGNGRTKEVKRELQNKRKKIKKDSDEMAYYIYSQSLVYEKERNIEKAHQFWTQLLIDYPDHPLEKNIIKKISLDQEIPIAYLDEKEWMKRAEKLIEIGLPRKASQIYNWLDPKKERLILERAHAHYKARDYTLSAKEYQSILDAELFPEQKVSHLLRLANSYGRSDQFNKAIATHKKIIEEHPQSSIRFISDRKLPFLLFDAGKYKESYFAYNKILPRLSGKHRLNAEWYRAWALYLDGKYEQARKGFKLLENKVRNRNQKTKYQYIQALAYEKMDQKEEADKIYQMIKNKSGLMYYKFLADSKLRSLSRGNNLKIDHQIFRDLNSAKELKRKNKYQKKIHNKDPFIKAISLSQAFSFNQAYEESRLSPYFKGPQKLKIKEYLTALYDSSNFNRIMSYGYLAQRGRLDGIKKEAWTLSYPKAYPQLVEYYSKKNDLDAELTWALMRQESAFKPPVQSSALAVGLMQIIPQTSYEIAEALDKDLFHPRDLADPLINIEFGTWYISHVKKIHDGNMIYAIASYNAGPDAVGRWKKWAKNLSPDEFIELIPYKETNMYVKKVLGNYWVYKGLY